MTASDWFVLAFLAPLLIAALWYVVAGVWRGGRDVRNAVPSISSDRSASGYHAFLGPATLSMTSGWLGTIATKIQQGMDSPRPWMDPLIATCFVACVGFLLLGWWLWAVRWPRFLVPPHFRDR